MTLLLNVFGVTIEQTHKTNIVTLPYYYQADLGTIRGNNVELLDYTSYVYCMYWS